MVCSSAPARPSSSPPAPELRGTQGRFGDFGSTVEEFHGEGITTAQKFTSDEISYALGKQGSITALLKTLGGMSLVQICTGD